MIYVPDANDQLIYVLGQVENPGALNLSPDMSLLDALSLSGGANRDSADEIFLVRSTNDSMLRFSMEELLSQPSQYNFSLEEGDILFVPERGISKFGYVLEKLSPLTGFIIFGNALWR